MKTILFFLVLTTSTMASNNCSVFIESNNVIQDMRVLTIGLKNRGYDIVTNITEARYTLSVEPIPFCYSGMEDTPEVPKDAGVATVFKDLETARELTQEITSTLYFRSYEAKLQRLTRKQLRKLPICR